MSSSFESAPLEANPADAAEQEMPAAPAADPAPSEVPEDVPGGVRDDVPVADALEQDAAVAPGQARTGRGLPLEADPADAAEQDVVVQADEDEGR
jgi:hypothetical protein